MSVQYFLLVMSLALILKNYEKITEINLLLGGVITGTVNELCIIHLTNNAVFFSQLVLENEGGGGRKHPS